MTEAKTELEQDHRSILETIKSCLEEAEEVVIFHHIRPDGDCLGSQFGLKELIKDNFKKKQVFAVGDSKGRHNFLEFNHDDEKLIFEKDASQINRVGIVVDAGQLARIELANLINKTNFKRVIRIDHHKNDDDLPPDTIRYVDPSFAACAEQITSLANELKWLISGIAASYLYLGIYTDSNRFLYASVKPRTLMLSKLLWDNGADYLKIHEQLSQTSLAEERLRYFIFENHESFGKVIFFKMSKKRQQKLAIPTPLEASRPNVLANINGYPIWAYFTEEENGKYRVELRSITSINVRDVAQQFGGGGHINASGAVVNSEKELKEVLIACNQQIQLKTHS